MTKIMIGYEGTNWCSDKDWQNRQVDQEERNLDQVVRKGF